MAYAVLLALITLGTVAVAIVANGNVGAALAPVLLIAFLYALWKIPLRYSVFLLIFCGLTLENPYEGFSHGVWQSPLAPLGAALLGNLNRLTGIQAMNFTGIDLLVPFLLLVAAFRRVTHSTIDGKGHVETARPMRVFALISLLASFGLWGWGLAHGGDFSQSLWQVHQILVLPVFFFLCDVSLRGPRDHAALAKIIVAAGLVRGLTAVYLRFNVKPPPPYVHYPYATTHADSMLFAAAFAVVLAIFVERTTRRNLLLLALTVPVLFAAMWANTRRLVWVEVGGVAIADYLFCRRRPLVRALTRAVVLGLPLILVYMVAGWSSSSGIFAPVQTVRSMIDPTSDSSTEYREIENLNLIFTLGSHPLLGPGFGHEYLEAVPLPDISETFHAYRYHPHNALLGLWAFTGMIGFSGLWVMLVVAVFLAARAHRRAKSPAERAAALSCIAAVIIYTNQVFGDIGLVSWTGVFLVAPAMAVAGKLAVATGAWPRVARRIFPGSAPAVAPLAAGGMQGA
ncbi:MAG TPA: O-antigen ligase family protein [Myxococcales bacterium]|nr:O-antigen ligase family protein [Myxococcales bacterium]